MTEMMHADFRPQHSTYFRWRRFFNWFPMGLTYAFLYMGRYNLTVAKNALGAAMPNHDFGIIFAAGTFTYAFAFLLNGPLTDKIGGRWAILIGAMGAALMNAAMGFLLYGQLVHQWNLNLVLAFSILYAMNMYFQSFGAVAIVKVNSTWFHVRERGIFGGIFGILISLGLYFAFDWSELIVRATAQQPETLSWIERGLRSILGIPLTAPQAELWWIFYVPALILLAFFVLEFFLLKDRPGQAGFTDFDTMDASSGEADQPFNLNSLLKRILTNKVIITVAVIELCTGVLRQGIMHWYHIFNKALGLGQDYFVYQHWGLLLMIAGATGGMVAGWLSDKVFGSRRGPVAALLYGVMILATVSMNFVLHLPPGFLAVVVILISICVIGTHGMLSGTATMDFGGRKGAATAVGLIDGAVYLGTGIQALALGFLTEISWRLWPLFLVPFSIIGFFLARSIWYAFPKARK